MAFKMNMDVSFSGLGDMLKKFRYRLGERPARDWLIILLVCTLVAVLSGLFALTVYTTAPETAPESSSESGAVSQQTIDRVLSFYGQRRTFLEDASFPTTTPVDPSH